MSDITLELGRRALGLQLADVIRDARRLIGWSQRELAARARTSQAMISRLETGRTGALDLAVVERVITALGLRGRLQLDDRHLGDRRRQRDHVHARISGSVARHLERDGWTTLTEVPIGNGPPRGWIDLLAYRSADRALLVEETKGDLPDFGALQRSLAFYSREAPLLATARNWRPTTVSVLVVALDSVALGRRLVENRELALRTFPAPIDAVRTWLRDARAHRPSGWAIGSATRRPGRPSGCGRRRSPHADAPSTRTTPTQRCG